MVNITAYTIPKIWFHFPVFAFFYPAQNPGACSFSELVFLPPNLNHQERFPNTRAPWKQQERNQRDREVQEKKILVEQRVEFPGNN
jgi:hypothetical protein